MRAALLDTLARAADAGGDDVSAAARVPVDPVLAPLVRRRLKLALEAAMLRDPTADAAHACRLAYLEVAGAPVTDAADLAAVTEKFVAARAKAPPAPRPRYWLTAAVSAAGLALAAWFVWVLAHADQGAPVDAAHRRAPTPQGAYLLGGAPGRAPDAAADVFARQLPRYLIALDHYQAAIAGGNPSGADYQRRALDELELPDADGAAALGAPVTARLRELIAAARAVAERGDLATTDAYLVAVGRLDDELAAAGLDLYVDGDVLSDGLGRRHLIIYAFTVEQVNVYRAGGREVRALRLRRLDSLNYEHGAIGFARPNLREALVLLDQTDGLAAERIWPALAPGASLQLIDNDGSPELAQLAAVESLAGEVARREFGVVSQPELTAAIADSTERHEVQHRLDYAAGGRRMPAALAELVGQPTDSLGQERPSAAGARDEMSAYLSELARDSRSPGVQLALLGRYLLDDEAWGSRESNAALVIFGGLERQLGLPAEPLLVDRRINRAAALRLLDALLRRPETELNAAAARLWKELFGEELAVLTRD